MKQHQTNRKLAQLMKKHQLTRAQAADLCMVSAKQVVDRYLASPTRTVAIGNNMKSVIPNHQYRKMPEFRLKILEMNLPSLERSKRDGSSSLPETN